jgi:hypothetical protein
MKTCTTCKVAQPGSQFVSVMSGTRITMTCLKCRQKTNKSTYKAGGRYQTLLDHYLKLKGSKPCEFCGDNSVDHIEFDHKDPKGLEYPQNIKLCKVRDAKTIAAMDEEAAKCRWLCRKCHCKRTAQQQSETKSNKIYLMTKKAIADRKRAERGLQHINNCKLRLGKCQADGCTDVFDGENLMFYEYDHIDHTTKTRAISAMVTYSIARIDDEISKCILLCGYCHQLRTKIQRQEIVTNVIANASEYIATNPDKLAEIPLMNMQLDWHTVGAHGTVKKQTRLTIEQVKEIRHAWNTSSITKKELVTKYNSSETTILEITSNKTWHDLEYSDMRS